VNKVAFLLIALALTSIAPRAQNGVFFMPLPPEALAIDVGANAFTVVGSFFEGGAFSWMPTTGTRDLGGFAAMAVSTDGKSIAGNALNAQGVQNAAVWQGGRQWRLLGSFTPNARPCDINLSSTFGASDNGRVVVGLGWDTCSTARAIRWEESTGVVNLGTTNGRSTRANAVSGDGRVVVGWQQNETGFREGAKWVDGRQEPIRNAGGRPAGEPQGANRDGSIIVGGVCDAFNPNPIDPSTSAAWKWTSAGVLCFPVRRPSRLPNLPYSTVMFDTSDDGRVIGGAYTFGLDSEALIWLDGGEGQFVRDFLEANGHPNAFRDWVNTGFITGVSPDGRTLVGYGAGPTTFQGYLIILPERGSR
jgi:uncharacterized membrane protein